MKINLKNGIDYKDEDDNVIFTYNKFKMRLTFYKDEDFKMGYIVASSPDLELFGNTLIGKNIKDVKNELSTFNHEALFLAEGNIPK